MAMPYKDKEKKKEVDRERQKQVRKAVTKYQTYAQFSANRGDHKVNSQD